jgi:hypothetical protein
MENKTDKQLVWESIKAIEHHTLSAHNRFHIIIEYEWASWSDKDKLRIRALLLSNSLVSIVGGNQWAFQLTPDAMVLKETGLREDGTLKPKTDKQYRKGVITVLIGTIIGAVLSTGLSAILEVWKAKYLTTSPTNTIVLPKIQLVHDTVWQKKILPKNP